ncbi:hypothetical protein ACFV5E_18810 [Streptomyces chartreusis]|uniref:hypothetical protein n=1 Tax=Streptomyces chartreusis TaxID=1969 RepID=UPI0036C72E12
MSTQDYEIDPAFAVAVTIVDSAQLPNVLGGEKFDVIVDPVGGPSVPGAWTCSHRQAAPC